MSETKLRQPVASAMSKQVVTVDAYDTVHSALEIMLENRVHTLPVVDGQMHCVGILSTSDFVDVAFDIGNSLGVAEHQSEGWWEMFIRNISQNAGDRSVMDLMSEEVISVEPGQSLADAATLIIQERLHRLPVIDDDNRLVGILSTIDILRAMLAVDQPA